MPFEEKFKQLNKRDDEKNELIREIDDNKQLLKGILNVYNWTNEQIIEVIK